MKYLSKIMLTGYLLQTFACIGRPGDTIRTEDKCKYYIYQLAAEREYSKVVKLHAPAGITKRNKLSVHRRKIYVWKKWRSHSRHRSVKEGRLSRCRW
jgi:hypothetical protein